jgi:hypothetical protein
VKVLRATRQSETPKHVSDGGSFRRKRPWRLAGPPMTLGNMRANGVRSMAVSCWQCHHEAVLSADRWPDHMAVPALGPRMVCTRCGIIGADARLNWREQRARETLAHYAGTSIGGSRTLSMSIPSAQDRSSSSGPIG